MDKIGIFEKVGDFISAAAIWLVLACLGMIAGAARYIHAINEGDRKFTWKSFLLHVMLSSIVAVFAGFATDYYAITGPLQFLIVGGAAFSSREICETVPSIFATVIKKQKL